ncbi:MAG TPA: hypothetical protein VK970_07840, partial [Candidatus Methylacidiphilales bacterium]|nr:hypothetical protein [Candidatus Methylacidiphilales bacterium]
ARLWSGIPAQSTTFDIDGVQVVRQVGVGLHLVDIPELAIRQGFEVVANENVVIDVIAAGEPVQLPVASDAVFLLSVRPTNPAAQIFIVNQQLSQLHESRRFFASGLGFGLYKVKVRLARDTTERIQLLDADTDVDFVDRLPDPQVPSPPTPLPTLEMPAMRPMMAPVRQAAILQPRMGTAVPFQNSFQATQQHTQAFEELTAPRMQLEGMQLEAPSAQGVAEIKIMARVWSASLWGDSAFELPWKKTTLYNSKGTPLLCLGDLTVGSESDEPFVSTTLSVSPGTYYLKHHMRNGRIVEHCLHVPRNWSVRAFMLASEAGTPTLPSHRQLATRPPQLDHFTFLMERSGSRGISELDEVIEAARIALIDQRSILSDELEELLMGKNENPIAGIIGAHLLIMEADNVAGAGNTAIPSRLAALDTVVGNLRRLVGDKHPDVEALSLPCPDPGLRTTTSTFTRPPMYARSWKLIMEGVASNPALISDSLWKRVSASLSTSGLLLWAKDKATKNNHEKQLKSWVTSMCMTAASDITGDDIAHMAGEISVPAKVVQEIWEQL